MPFGGGKEHTQKQITVKVKLFNSQLLKKPFPPTARKAVPTELNILKRNRIEQPSFTRQKKAYGSGLSYLQGDY